MTRSSNRPSLWHIPVSHYSEKARWALAWKGVAHDLHAPPPGPHMAFAQWLSRGKSRTFPLLILDGQVRGDSTAIIAALEERYPDRPLYPSDPAERSRALALEDFFDEELGPYSRHLAFHYLRKDPKLIGEFAGRLLPGPVGRSEAGRRVGGAIASNFSRLRYGVGSDEAADQARAKILVALDRLEAELGGGEHLVGDSFSVADLTAASLFVPLVAPPEGPVLPELGGDYAELRESLSERVGYRWVERTFARYRRPASS